MEKRYVPPVSMNWKRKRFRRSRQKRQAQALPQLRFTPYAWSKLLYLRDAGPTEIGAMGIAVAGEPLLIEDLGLVRQRCDWASVQFDDGAVADFFDAQVDAGRRPEEFGRIWIHTHPGSSPLPSATDEATFQRVFGGCDWAVMFILACGGASYARLRLALGGGVELPVGVEFKAEFRASDQSDWAAEYAACVEPIFTAALPGEERFDWLSDPLSESLNHREELFYGDY